MPKYLIQASYTAEVSMDMGRARGAPHHRIQLSRAISPR